MPAVGGGTFAVGVRRPRGLPLVDHQVDWHLALQAADVAVAEVVAQLVNLDTNNAHASFSGSATPSIAKCYKHHSVSSLQYDVKSDILPVQKYVKRGAAREKMRS